MPLFFIFWKAVSTEAQEKAKDMVHAEFCEALVKMNNVCAGWMEECELDHGIATWVHSYSNGHIWKTLMSTSWISGGSL